MTNRQLNMFVIRQEISKSGTGAFPLLVGCGVKPHDVDLDFDFDLKNKNSEGLINHIKKV
jgi:hypothetical protein